MNTTKMDVALAYAAQGFYVFPCLPKLKTPATVNGFKDATTDLDQIREWWSDNPEYNPAFVPHRSGLGLIDLDGKAGIKAYEAVKAEFQLEDTFKVRTPRGGYHLYFIGELPSSVWTPKTKRCLGEHIDTRGIGGYALLPGAFVDDGKSFGSYEVVDDRECAIINPAVAIRLRKREATTLEREAPRDAPVNITRAVARLRSCVAAGLLAISGHGGDDTTFGLACELVGDLGLNPGTAADLMLDHWYPHCLPNNDPDWIRFKCRNAGEYCQNTPGSAHVEAPSTLFAAAAAALPQEPEAQPRDNPFYFKDDAEQDADTEEEEWLVKDFIPRVGTVEWDGQKGEFKTYLVQHVGLAIAAGLPVFGMETSFPGAVFYAAHEGRKAIEKARKRAWKEANKIVSSSVTKLPFYVAPAPRIKITEHCELFKQAIRDRMVKEGIKQVRMIVLDTYAKCMVGLDEIKAVDAGLYIAFVDDLVHEFQCAVVTVHHLGKDRDKGGRGSSALWAGMNTVIVCQRHDKTLHVEAQVKYQKDGDEGSPIFMKGRPVNGSLVFDRVNLREHQTAVDAGKIATGALITLALKKFKAFEPAMLTTHLLAEELLPKVDGESIDDREARVNTLRLSLVKRAKSDLQNFCPKRPDGSLQWSLPAPSA